ncbi:MAG: hypothetical protein IT437_04370 [Phycisphaerales bacterium]|nr:hypothetical protein [Phycisphaerales bacterium]
MNSAMLHAPAHAPDAQPGDLADLMRAFNEVTGRLQATHESLRGEVAGLQRELRDANEQLARSRRLAALGEMAAGIAHEVRNPLSSIRLYARMLEQDLAGRPAEAGTAAKIVQAVRGLDAVVGDVLIFARELRTRPVQIEARAAFARAIDACTGETPRGVRVDHRDSGVALAADPALLHQALVNVVRNALEAMTEVPPPPGGHVLTLDASCDAARGGRCACVTLTVTDTGPGVAPEVVDRMFNPFFTTRATGTGLGLAIVHRIVDAHGGWVSASGRTGGTAGAVFELSFPAAQDAPGTRQEAGR